MVKHKKAAFRGRQQNLYTLARKAWGYCLENMADIGKAKALYMPTFIAEQMAKVDTAEALPDYYNRKDIPQEVYDNMKKAGLAVTDEWQFLKDYTVAAFSKELLKSKLEAAGQAYYRDATSGDWDSTASLINAAKTFLATNASALLANDNMPKEFPANFEVMAKAFHDLRTSYFGKEDTKNNLTSDKDKADAAILETLMPMLKLACRVYKNDPGNKAKFTYAKLLKEVRGNDDAGLKGVFTAADTKKPLARVDIRAIDTDYATTSDEQGRFFLSMASGVYDIEVSAPGYQLVTLKNRKIEVGTKHRLNLALEALPTLSSSLTKEMLNGLMSTSTASPVTTGNGVGV